MALNVFVQSDGAGRFRIDPDVEIVIAWEALAVHESATVRKIAQRELARTKMSK